MGIINLSPESFFKGSIKQGESIAEAALKMEKDGADIIDLGAMSTAPYLDTMISIEEEIRRIRDGIERIRSVSDITLSIDTPRAEVAEIALGMDASIINDVTGMKYDERMADVIKDYNASVIISAYSRSRVRGDMDDTIRLLRESIEIASSKDIDENRIIIDPAIGFFRMDGKNPFFTPSSIEWFKRDLSIIKNLKELRILGKPICISLSRKSFIGKILGLSDPADRLIGSIASEILAVINGADIIRTHNVYESKHAIRMVEAIRNAE